MHHYMESYKRTGVQYRGLMQHKTGIEERGQASNVYCWKREPSSYIHSSGFYSHLSKCSSADTQSLEAEQSRARAEHRRVRKSSSLSGSPKEWSRHFHWHYFTAAASALIHSDAKRRTMRNEERCWVTDDAFFPLVSPLCCWSRCKAILTSNWRSNSYPY